MKGIVHSQGRILILSILLWTQAEAQRVSFTLRNEPVEHAFSAIQQQVKYRFIYTEEMVQHLPPVFVVVNKLALPAALNQLFSRLPLTYSLEDDLIFIRQPSTPTLPQAGEVTGRITDDSGQPIAGATIAVKGSQKATSSDSNGEFILADMKPGDVLVVSSIGYRTVETEVRGRRFIAIQLSIAVNVLDETVIRGYYMTSRRLNTGAVSKVTGETISRQPVNNPLQALEGRVPGLVVSQVTGMPGGRIDVQLRGQNSIASGNNPLFIVDGVPVSATPLTSSNYFGSQVGGNPFSSFAPGDIESIEVLKDADATAIYGSRGANGVILITTKKGKEGKTTVTAEVYSGAGKVTRQMHLLNTPEYLAMRHEAFANDGASPQFIDLDVNGTWDTSRYTDWQKVLIGGTMHVTNAQLSFSGGSQATQFLLGGGYYREGTVLPGNFSDGKASVHFNLHHSSENRKLALTLSASYVAEQSKLPYSDITAMTLLPPDAPPVFDSTGGLNWGPLYFDNPFAYLRQKMHGRTDNMVSNFVASYQLLPSLQFKASTGFTSFRVDQTGLQPLSTFHPLFGFKWS